jgi:cytochrome c biogenesis protein CcmG, thiol:disulfide interchange protein DsbE
MAKAKTDRLLLILMGVTLAGLVFSIKDSFVQRIVEQGDKAPGFAVTTENGNKITPSDFGGKLLVLNFWATWCPPCVEETPSLSEFAKIYGKDGIVVVAVSVDKSDAAYRRFLAQVRPGFQTARDPDADVPARFGTFKWPETYVIDQSGRVRQKYISNRNWMDPAVVNEIRSFL